MHQPKADRRHVHRPEDIHIEVDVPTLVDRQRTEVEAVLGRILRLVHDDRLQSEQRACHVGHLVRRPHPSSGPDAALLDTEHLTRAEDHPPPPFGSAPPHAARGPSSKGRSAVRLLRGEHSPRSLPPAPPRREPDRRCAPRPARPPTTTRRRHGRSPPLRLPSARRRPGHFAPAARSRSGLPGQPRDRAGPCSPTTTGTRCRPPRRPRRGPRVFVRPPRLPRHH